MTMNKIQCKEANINNLISLWTIMGVKSVIDNSKTKLIQSSNWPNRCWVDSNKKFANNIKIEPISFAHFLSKLPQKMILPVWDQFDWKVRKCKEINAQEEILLNEGFTCAFQQTAMIRIPSSLSCMEVTIPDQEKYNDMHQINTIHTDEEIKIWVNIASQSFGYDIDISTIERIANVESVTLLMHYYHNKPAGVAMLYKTDNALGVHQVGVLEEFRGKGIAKSLMQNIITISKELKTPYITLQASAAGKPLYISLGFIEQFTVKNYVRSL